MLKLLSFTILWYVLWRRNEDNLRVRDNNYCTRYFNPRSPCGERPARADIRKRAKLISIHAPRAGSDGLSRGFRSELRISIHAPSAGSDGRSDSRVLDSENFNPRSPCGERRENRQKQQKTLKFQSTLPVRGATYLAGMIIFHQQISIHAPRAGSDPTNRY